MLEIIVELEEALQIGVAELEGKNVLEN